jgi:hypothetical protein
MKIKLSRPEISRRAQMSRACALFVSRRQARC